MENLDYQLHLLALNAISTNSVKFLKYVMELNRDYYNNTELLNDLYLQADICGSQDCIELLKSNFNLSLK